MSTLRRGPREADNLLIEAGEVPRHRGRSEILLCRTISDSGFGASPARGWATFVVIQDMK